MFKKNADISSKEYLERVALRQKLFESLCNKNQAEILPGRYGGAYNSNMLALYESSNLTLLVLGLLELDGEGGLQLDPHSLGNHVQFSEEWLDVLIFSFAAAADTRDIASHLAKCRAAGSLQKACMYLHPETQEVCMLKIGSFEPENKGEM